jgi:putative ABC transport system permease protein
MRTTDLIVLALSALAQQKLRTALTTLGIVFATVMLVASLALRRGVGETITREYGRYNELRQIDVRPGAPAPEAREARVEVRGKMSDERRERLRQELSSRQPRHDAPALEVRLTPERLQELAELPHVVAVRPLAVGHGRAILGDRVEHVATVGAPTDDERLRRRLVAGALFESPSARDALVSEYLLYQFGIEDEASAAAAVGKTIRLEYRSGGKAAPNMLLNLLHGGSGQIAASEEKLLGKLVQRLPQAVTKLDLSPEDQEALLKVLKRPPPRPSPIPEGLTEETLTIRGVLRAPDRDDMQRGWFYRHADVVLPQRTAEELLARMPYTQMYGFDHVTVEVDHVENVKKVHEHIRAAGFGAHSAVEMIEREQFVYMLVFESMTAMALIALTVSGSGITNIMLMSVLERVREIGVMKAVGARDRHILAIFLVEGALVGLVGGCLGLLLTWAASFPTDAWLRALVARNLHVRLESSVFAFSWWLLVGAPIFAALVTTLAALLPARRAVRVDPIAALRHE